jgi:hypothetical protein
VLRGWLFWRLASALPPAVGFVAAGLLISAQASLAVVMIPIFVGILAGLPIRSRGRRGFWPWDRKRRKIALFAHLVDADS